MAGSSNVEYSDEQTLVVRASGLLDRRLAHPLLHVAVTAAAERVPRTHVDLGGVWSYTNEAAVAVTRCRGRAALMPDRVCVTAGL